MHRRMFFFIVLLTGLYNCVMTENFMSRDVMEILVPESCQCDSTQVGVIYGEAIAIDRYRWNVTFNSTRGGATYLFGKFLINDQRPQHWNGILYGCDTPRCFISYANLVGPELDTTRNHITLPCPDPACATAPD